MTIPTPFRSIAMWKHDLASRIHDAVSDRLSVVSLNAQVRWLKFWSYSVDTE